MEGLKHEWGLYVIQILTALLFTFAVTIAVVFLMKDNLWAFIGMILLGHVAYWFMLYQTEREYTELVMRVKNER